MGFGDDVVQRHRQQVAGSFVIMACNADAVGWFVDHQAGIWRYGFNGLESMDYSQINAALQLEQAQDAAGLFEKLRHIERGFIAEINQQRKQQQRKS